MMEVVRSGVADIALDENVLSLSWFEVSHSLFE